MKEYIEREAALSVLQEAYDKVRKMEAIPAADVVEVRQDGKKILDVTCGNRTIWFQKNEPHTIYCDKRREEWAGDFGKALNANGKYRDAYFRTWADGTEGIDAKDADYWRRIQIPEPPEEE